MLLDQGVLSSLMACKRARAEGPPGARQDLGAHPLLDLVAQRRRGTASSQAGKLTERGAQAARHTHQGPQTALRALPFVHQGRAFMTFGQTGTGPL